MKENASQRRLRTERENKDIDAIRYREQKMRFSRFLHGMEGLLAQRSKLFNPIELLRRTPTRKLNTTDSEGDFMTTQHSDKKAGAMPAKDASGEPVPVVERNIRRPDPDTDKVDKAITPKSIKSHEQDAEKLQDKVTDVEKKLDR
ncbi:hypothetical protein [Pseudomonas uvaldensis]|uniref:hypothetical protein n=1 Tax=Pseudomonas uvaldensis TaxID=2878385 RepID=UPI002FCD8A6C